MDQRLPDPAVTDWRGLCAELLDEVAARPLILDRELIARARAALAQPEPDVVRPTDEELLKLARAELNNSPNWEEPEYDASNPFPCEAPGVAWLNFARAVLACWGAPGRAPAGELLKEAAWLRNECSAENADGNWISMSIDQALDLASLLERQAAPAPAEGEVGELVALIRQISLAWEPDACLLGNMTAGQLTRAADLLEQRHPTPVSVSERLPGPEDCDAEGRCWWGKPYGYRGRNIEEPYWVFGDSDCYRFMPCTLWLPATALPLPQGEVE